MVHHGEGKSRGVSAWGFGLRHCCVLGIISSSFIIVGLLTTPYLGYSLQVMLKRSPLRSGSLLGIERVRTVIQGAPSENFLEIVEESSVQNVIPPNKFSTAIDFSSEKDPHSGQEVGQTHVQNQKVLLPVVMSNPDEQVSAAENMAHSENVQVAKPGKRPGTNSKLEDQQRIKLKIPKLSAELEITDGMQDRMASYIIDPVPMISNSSTTTMYSPLAGSCDVTVGKWVPDPAGPLYRFDECRILSGPQNCQRNGRPDHEYEFYKWQPDKCTIPRFDANAFLELMRGKTLAFIGDSLARNQMESLMCILLQAAAARSKGSKKMQRWYFGSYNFTVIRLWSSWLVQTKGDFPPSFAPNGTNRLDLMEIDEEYAYHLPKFDVIILSSGHWWLRKTAFFMNGQLLGGAGWLWLPSEKRDKIDPVDAFGIAMDAVLRKVGAYPGYKGLTILRTYTPDHYSGGSWDTGGSCTGETRPYKKGPEHGYNGMMHGKQIEAFKQNTKRGEVMPNGSKLKLLDVYPVLNYRGDGHPGPYRSTDPAKKTMRDAKGRPPPQDCLHWCMPGPIDTMNELLFEVLKEEFQ